MRSLENTRTTWVLHGPDRKSTRLNSSHSQISYAVFCLKKNKRHPEWDWSGPACVALAVDDVRAAIDICRRHRVKVLIEPVQTRVCWMACIPDPDGNRLCLHSRKDGTAG